MSLSVSHAMTVDVEDWYHICGVADYTVAPRDTWRVVRNTEKILALFEEYQCKATFFVLGSVAAAIPELAPMIAAKGHEIASHGWSHKLVTHLDPDEFRDEIEHTADILEQQTGQRPVGFRAPRWSLCRRKTPWAFEILSELGYLYDSSLTPLAVIGDADGPLHPHQIGTISGPLWEIPPLVTSTQLGNLPTGGGWGFRCFPYFLINRTLHSYTAMGQPAVLFVHPRELDPEGPRIHLGILQSFFAYGLKQSSEERLMQVLRSFKFSTLKDMVSLWPTAGFD
jgi:peptidoglycan-N-acetylglucosamine deacetylase